MYIVLVKYHEWGDSGHALLDPVKLKKSRILSVKSLEELNELFTSIDSVDILDKQPIQKI